MYPGVNKLPRESMTLCIRLSVLLSQVRPPVRLRSIPGRKLFIDELDVKRDSGCLAQAVSQLVRNITGRAGINGSAHRDPVASRCVAVDHSSEISHRRAFEHRRLDGVEPDVDA